MSLAITLQDAILLARYGFRFTPDMRTLRCRQLLVRVCEAAFYMKLTGQAHPFYGDGSISSLVLRTRLRPMPLHVSLETLAAFDVAFREIAGLLATLPDLPHQS